MKNLRPFQMILLGLSVFIFFFAIISVSLYKPQGEQELNPFPDNVQIWGTFESAPFTEVLRQLGKEDERYEKVKYVQVSEDQFVSRFVNALAEGTGPDLILLPHDLLVELRPKLFALSYEFYDKRTFYNSFVDGSEIFARSNGVYAVPLAVDPLVMYWNRDILSSNNISQPPATWEQLRNDSVPRLTKLTATRDILRSGVAFGEYRNVRNAQEVFALLLMQSGSDIVTESDGDYGVVLSQSTTGSNLVDPAATVLNFYTEFSNPVSSLYSWNRSLPEDRSHFLSGDLALYFGYGSEFESLQQSNPNLNFDMAPVPQGEGATVLRGYGRFYGYAIPLKTRNSGVSYAIADTLSQPLYADQIVAANDLASVHRAALAVVPADPYQQIRNSAALIARGWLTPGTEITDDAFLSMVEDVTSGRLSITSAVQTAKKRLELGF